MPTAFALVFTLDQQPGMLLAVLALGGHAVFREFRGDATAGPTAAAAAAAAAAPPPPHMHPQVVGPVHACVGARTSDQLRTRTSDQLPQE